MDFIKGLWRDLRARPVDTLVRWQEQRFLWLLMAIAMGGLIILAHSFFQIYLYMAPCEQCVYIRYAMFVMVIGGVIAAINPKNIVLKLIGCIAAFYGSIMALSFLLSLMVSIMRYIMRTPIHFLACKDVRLIRPFLSTYRWRNGHRSGLNLPETAVMTRLSSLMA